MNTKLKTNQTGSPINITWGKAEGVDGYKVYATNCGKNFNVKYAVQVKGKTVTMGTTIKAHVAAFF